MQILCLHDLTLTLSFCFIVFKYFITRLVQCSVQGCCIYYVDLYNHDVHINSSCMYIPSVDRLARMHTCTYVYMLKVHNVLYFVYCLHLYPQQHAKYTVTAHGTLLHVGLLTNNYDTYHTMTTTVTNKKEIKLDDHHCK